MDEETRLLIKSLREEIEAQNIQISRLSKQIEAFKNSSCWRITLPIRIVGDVFSDRRKYSSIFFESLKEKGLSSALGLIVMHIQKIKRDEYLSSSQYSSNYKTGSSKEKKIIEYTGILLEDLHRKNITVYNEDKVERKDNYNYRVLFVSHLLDRTGAPGVLMDFAKHMQMQGNFAMVLSLKKGDLEEELIENEIPFGVSEDLFSDDFIARISHHFDWIVVNTVACTGAIKWLSGGRTPVLWWIHEAEASYNEGVLDELPNYVERNIHIYCVGKYAQKVLRKYKPNYYSEELLYYIPKPLSVEISSFRGKYGIDRDRLIFVTVGVMEYRKGQDILSEAIRKLDEQVLKKSLFVIVGKQYYAPFVKIMAALADDFPDSVLLLEEMNKLHLFDLYRDCDCLICPSRDDPMPCTITEALSLGKPIISTENTGYAEILKGEDCGCVYTNNDSDELAKLIAEFVYNQENAKNKARNSRTTYEKYFSREVFENNVNNILKKDVIDEDLRQLTASVSVVIPTYNAGTTFETTIELLERQKNIDKLEIIVVDSGSTDCTIEICRRHNVKLVEIANAEFTHSFARNLGFNNSNGEIVVFMTQDALPSSDVWVSQLIYPLLNSNVVAVSCRENSEKLGDLYYRVNMDYHTRYVGIYEHDRIGLYLDGFSIDELRKNASLTDVSCAVRSDIFRLFQYRNDYAEDLDLGIRLIKSGYKIKLMHDPVVYHGHRRSVGYEVRRAIVDNNTLNTILGIKRSNSIDEEKIYSKVYFGYYATITLISELKKTTKSILDEAVKEACSKTKKIVMDNSLQYTDEIEDETLSTVIIAIKALTPHRINMANEIVNELYDYYNQLFKKFIDHSQYNGDIIDGLSECFLKRYATLAGIELSLVEPDGELGDLIRELSKGI